MRDLFGNVTPEARPQRKRDEAKELNHDENSGQPARVAVSRTRNFARRVASSLLVEDVLPWHFKDGESYHYFTFGDVDALTALKSALKQQPLEYVLLSTFSMAVTDVELLADWVRRGMIGRMDFYLGEIFNGKFADVYLAIKDLITPAGGRIAVFRNHSKVFVGFGDRFDFVVESSANINTNPRCEQTCITVDTSLARWYKSEVFDKIKAFNKDMSFKDWKPYILQRDETV